VALPTLIKRREQSLRLDQEPFEGGIRGDKMSSAPWCKGGYIVLGAVADKPRINSFTLRTSACASTGALPSASLSK
jgi:hypothetical protein